MAARADVRSVAIAMTVAIFSAASAHAGESPLIAMFDTDHDGCVSLTEYQTYMAQGFQRMDANGDDVLDASELPAGNHRHAPLTLQQHRRNVARQFKRQDIDHDGCLGLDELMAPPR